MEWKTNNWVFDKIGSVLMLRKSMAERKMRIFGHIVRKNSMEKNPDTAKMEGKRRRGRPAKTWFQDLYDWTKMPGQSWTWWINANWRLIVKMA